VTVKELIIHLQTYDPDLPVYTSAEYELEVGEESITVEHVWDDRRGGKRIEKALVISA
jgi:hypothetical protein